MDPILIIIGVIGYIIVSVVSNLAEKKKQRQMEEEARRAGHTEPPRAPSQQPARGSLQDWQEQLKRMLHEQSGQEPPPVIHAPPPERRPPPPQAQPPPSRRLSPTQPSPQRQLSPETRRPASSAMNPATSIYDKAAQLQETVAKRIDIIEQKKSDIRKEIKSDIPSRPTRTLHRKEPPRRPAQVRRAIQLVRDRDKIRDAFVASVILGPPKALEEKS